MTGFLVIGGGPAGLAAAEVLARAGRGPVTLVERRTEVGGVPRFCGHSPFGMREFQRVLSGKAYALRLEAAARKAGVEIRCDTSVTAIGAGEVALSSPKGGESLRADRILLATGAREASRAERLLPGDRPLGVVTTGALQEMWFAHGAVPFRRPVIVGSELVAMSAILTCRQAGARVQAIVEAGPGARVRVPFRWLPGVLGLSLLRSTSITDVVARDGRVDHILVENARGQTRIDCDGLILTGDFQPESALARLSGVELDPATGGPRTDEKGRTSRPGLYAAGNILPGVKTAGACWSAGRAVARTMLEDG